VQCGAVRCGVVRCGAVRCGAARRGAALCAVRCAVLCSRPEGARRRLLSCLCKGRHFGTEVPSFNDLARPTETHTWEHFNTTVACCTAWHQPVASLLWSTKGKGTCPIHSCTAPKHVLRQYHDSRSMCCGQCAILSWHAMQALSALHSEAGISKACCNPNAYSGYTDCHSVKHVVHMGAHGCTIIVVRRNTDAPTLLISCEQSLQQGTTGALRALQQLWCIAVQHRMKQQPCVDRATNTDLQAFSARPQLLPQASKHDY
jgi:hypothetical protein